MDENEKKYIDDTKEYWQGFPEAPVSDTFKWIDARGFEHLLTMRAYSPHLLFKQIEKTTSGIQEIGGHPIQSRDTRPPASGKIQERDEAGLLVVDGDGQPVMKDLPTGTAVYTVNKAYHGKTQTGKDFLGIVTLEKPHNRKWGIKCFRPPFDEWKSWTVGTDEPNYMTMPEQFKHAVIREPQEEGKYPEVVEFRE